MTKPGKCCRCGGRLNSSSSSSACWHCMIDSDKSFAHYPDSSVVEPLAPAGKQAPEACIEFGDYLLEEEIAHGGMGVVYRARQRSLGRVVAIKLLLLGRYSSAASVERFQREAKAVASLRHPHIVSVYEVGECDGQHFFAMEFVEGGTLAEILREGPLPARRAAELVRDVAGAIHYAHTQGVLHRDLKPSNVLIDALGQVRITDFGLVKKLDGSSDLTLTGQMVGTPNYLSPEQAAGRQEALGPASDVYAMGAVLYELLTGRPPFLTGSLQETLQRIRDAEPVGVRALNPAIHRDLETICLKCLEKEPARRYATAEALGEDLARWLQRRPIAARPAGGLERAWLWCKRRPRQAAMVGVLGLALSTVVLLLAGITVVSHRARVHAETQELTARRRGYAADINLIQQALELNNLGRAEELLDQHRPRPGQPDLRDWEWRYLWQQCQSEALFTLSQRSNSIWSVATSHDGQWLAVGEAEGGGLSIWDLTTRRKTAELVSGHGEVQVAFSPQQPVLAYSHESGRRSTPFHAGVRLWNAATGKAIRDLPLDGRCRGLAFSRDGRRLLTSSSDPGNRLTVWQVADGQKLLHLVAPQLDGVGTPLAATPDLSLAAYRTDRNNEICLIDLISGTERWKTKATEENVTALAFSADGRILASGSGYTESAVRLWEVATGEEIGRLEGHTSWVSALAFWPDGNTLASAGADQTIRIWNLATRQSLGTLRGHRREIWRLVLLGDGASMVTGSKDGAINVWDTRALRPDRRRVIFPDPVAGWHVTPDSRSILTIDRQGAVAEWRGAFFGERQPVLELGGPVARACVSGDGARLAAQSPGGSIQVWDLPKRVLLGQFTVPGSQAFLGAFRENGTRLVLPNWQGDDFHEWDLADFRETQTWNVASDRPAWALSADGRWCLSIGQEANTMLRDLVTGHMKSGRLDIEVPGGIAISSDTKQIAAVSKQSYVRLWDLAHREIATFRGFLQGLHGVTFSANSRRLAIGSNGREAVKLWDLESRQELLTLAGQGYIFKDLRFSPDGNILTARSGQGLLHLWQAPSWEEIATAEKPAR
jgi:eukaryotic-like serine/threonine-protein kinase